MNFEVYCFDFVNERLTIVQKEYFNTYAEAKAFENSERKKYEGGISITPMNQHALNEMTCVQCGGRYGSESCKTCKCSIES